MVLTSSVIEVYSKEHCRTNRTQGYSYSLHQMMILYLYSGYWDIAASYSFNRDASCFASQSARLDTGFCSASQLQLQSEAADTPAAPSPGPSAYMAVQ